MLQFDAVLFDMDGLMFDTERLADEIWGAVGPQFGLSITHDAMARMRGTNDADGRAIFMSLFGPDAPYDAILAEAHRRIREYLAHKVPMRPGLPELLSWLREHGVSMAVASSTTTATVRRMMATAGVAHYFSAVIGGDMVKHSKPDPEIFQIAAAALGAEPARCMVLEDSYNGVRAGAAGGFFTVMVPDMDPPTPEMERLADAIAPSLADVPALFRNAQDGKARL